MITFITGLVVLIIGGLLYGRFAERVIKPTDSETPAIAQQDGVDFVPMGKWKNSLIELLNIAGTGPILGPLQGILFGPIAFITIPIGCVIGGAFHDFMTGMISTRNKGSQLPELVRKFLGKHLFGLYLVFVSLALFLLAAVFIYTPGDLFVTQILKSDSSSSNPIVWLVYGGIFLYYLVATLFPIDKIIGKIYPIFGAVLLLSAVGVFIGIFVKGYPLVELWDAAGAGYPFKTNFIPVFFVTVACGICSGFHSTQATIVSRTIKNEHEGRMIFYNTMILEGFIAMIWAAAGMGVLQAGLTDVETLGTQATKVVGIVAKDMLGGVGGIIAIIGVIVLPITSGDTALRSIRMMVGDAIKIDQTKKKNALCLALGIFAVVAAILIWSKLNPAGFNTLWQYFAWANEVIAVFSFAMIARYMKRNNMPYIMAVLPGAFYMFVITSYLLSAPIGFNLPWIVAYIGAGALALIYSVEIMVRKTKTVNGGVS